MLHSWLPLQCRNEVRLPRSALSIDADKAGTKLRSWYGSLAMS
jgi:hypothetical protein